MFNSGIRGRKAKDAEGIINPQVKYLQTSSPQPSISTYAISGLDDTALDTNGGQTIIVTGSGFSSGISATLGGTLIGAVTVLSPTQISFTSPAKTPGTYGLVVYYSTGGAAILAPGLTYSSVPTYTTAAGTIGTVYETKPINTSVVATSDSALTYTLASGSLPTGATLSSSGVITGTAPASAGSTTYTFAITATDAELQDVTRTFTLTVNTDVVTWVTPSSGSTINVTDPVYSQSLSATDAAGYAVTYSADTLPAGLTLTSGTISGTISSEAPVTTVLTATAATSNRNSTNTITWSIVLNDAYWKFTPLVLTASPAVQTQSFVTDASINNNQITIVGDTRANPNTPYQYGYYSVNFGANGQYLTGSNSLLNVSNQATAWTFECWVFPVAAGAIFAIGSGGAYGNSIYIDWGQTTANKFNISQSNGSSAPVNFGTTNATYTGFKWYHLAITRTTLGVVTIYVNGVADGTATYNTAGFASGTTFVVNGSYDNNGLGANGSAKYISNLRFTINQVLYSSNFTPSTAPLTPAQNTLLLLCQSYGFYETSPNNLSVTLGSTPSISINNPFGTPNQVGTQNYSWNYPYSAGIGPSVSVPASAFMMSTNNFTVEGWLYCTNYSNGPVIYDNWAGSPSGSYVANQWQIWVTTGGVLTFTYCPTASTSTAIGTGTISINTWYHFAVTRSGTTVTVYLNGVVSGSGTLSITTIGVNYAGSIGRQTAIGAGVDSYSWSGQLSNIRVIGNQALYSGAFTPPTSGLTTSSVGTTGANVASSITGTVILLTCQNSTVIDNGPSAYTLTPNSQVSVTPTSPFSYSGYTSTTLTTLGSGYLDGTGDYCSMPNSPAFQLGTGDFTVEFWWYLTTTFSSIEGPGIGQKASDSTNGWVIYRNHATNTDKITIRISSSNSDYSATVVPKVNCWQHWAVVRSGTTLTWYCDGAICGTYTGVSGNATDTTGLMYIGYAQTWSYTTGASYFSNVRVVKSAVYTNTFAPPFVSQLTAISNTQLLTLQTNGTHNNSTIFDNSRLNNLVTRTGDVAVGTFSPYGDSWSVYNSGNTNGLFVAYNSGMLIGTGQFTIEAWVYPTGTQTTQQTIVSNRTNNATGAGTFSFYINATTNVLKFDEVQTPSNIATSTTAVVPNTWQHVAVTRDSSNNIRFFINGVLAGTAVTSTFNFSSTNAYQIAYNYDASGYSLIGYISNVRVNIGEALYTAGFTPSTVPLLATSKTRILACQSAMLVDSSPNNAAITTTGSPATSKFSPFSNVTTTKYYSQSFTGSTNYLTLSSAGAAMSLTADFTVEFWIYPVGMTDGSYYHWVSSGFNGQVFKIWWAASGGTVYFYNGSSINFTSNVSMIVNNAWHHLAFVRSGANSRLYVNGTGNPTVSTSLGTIAWDTTFNVAGGSASENFPGAISNLRVVKGTALYDITQSTITVPTAPLTAVSGTSLLTLQSSTLIDNSTNKYTITQTGSGRPIAASPFTQTVNSAASYSPSAFSGSLYFDGAGDYLTVPYTPPTGDFSVDVWVYVFNRSTTQYLFTFATAEGAGRYTFFITTAGLLGWDLYGTGTTTYGTNTVPINSWAHIAYARIGTTITAYINGVAAGTSTKSGTMGTGTTIFIGKDGVTSYFTGYMSDFRFLQGAAFNSLNFAPQVSPSTVTNTNQVMLINATGSSITDQSRINNLETLGDAKSTNFGPYNGTYYSNYFNGSTDFINTSYNAAFDFGTGDFTVEGWINPSAITTNRVFASTQQTGGASGWSCFIFASGYIGFDVYESSTEKTLTASTTLLTPGNWYHIAYTRQSGTFRMFVNGVSQTFTGTQASNMNSLAGLTLGKQAQSGYEYWFNGYVSNFRVVKGTSLYNAGFTPSATPLTAVAGTSALTCQSNKFVDNSTNAFALTVTGSPKVQTQNPFQVNTGLSYYFDGTGDYLTTHTGNGIVAFGTGDYTIECWVYFSSNNATYNPFIRVNGGAYCDFGYDFSVSKLQYNTNASILSITWTPTIGQWYHMALVRSSANAKIYANGVNLAGAGAADTFNISINSTSTFVRIGGSDYSAAHVMYGYITDMRITKGYARYTTAFTPPTSPLKIK